jgi:hypothetical protein
VEQERIVMSKQDRRDAFTAWRAVDPVDRASALRNAKIGKSHTDRAVAEAANAWARAVLAVTIWNRTPVKVLLWIATAGALALGVLQRDVVSLVIGVMLVLGLAYLEHEASLARRVLAVKPRGSTR